MRTVTLSPKALKDFEELKRSDVKLLAKIISLISEIAVTPFDGTGNPDPLKRNLKDKWSRRITQEHSLVYEVKDETIIVIHAGIITIKSKIETEMFLHFI